MSDITITLRGGSEPDAPWITIHADSLEDAIAHLHEEHRGLMWCAQVLHGHGSDRATALIQAREVRRQIAELETRR